MNFVCFSFLSPPATDAESACTGRLVSSLAEAGHHVTLVSLDYSNDEFRLPDDISHQLLSEKVRVVRIDKMRKPFWGRLASKVRFGLFGICTEYIPDCIRVVNNELRQLNHPVLLTRSAWPASNLVGWYCRKNACCWIPHFSDPFPSYKRMGVREYWRYPFAWRWLYRIALGAGAVSVTNRHAIKYFSKILPRRLIGKFFVLYHIGAPRIRSIGYSVPRIGDEKVLVVAGALFKGRNYDDIRAAVHNNPNVRLLEYSGANLSDLCPGIDEKRVTAPSYVTDAMSTADAIVVSDLDSGFGYCPYLASKFAYAAVLGKPLICVSENDSEVFDFSRQYAGVYFIERHNTKKLSAVLEDLVAGKLAPVGADLASLFLPQDVVTTLVAHCRL